MDGLSSGGVVVIAIIALVATLGATEFLVRGVGRLARNLGLIGGIVGLIVALGADSPEIASAMSAIANGSAITAAGIVIGSNVFNVAILLGSGAIAAGSIETNRAAILIDASVALAMTVILGTAIEGVASVGVMWTLMLLIFIPYVTYLGIRPASIARFPLPSSVRALIARASGDADVQGDEVETALEELGHMAPLVRSWRPVAAVAPALVVIMLGSMLLVQSALTLGTRFSISKALIGLLILAGITSLPNAYAATRLAMGGHGAAVVSAAFNSNTLNIIGGIAVPALFVPGILGAVDRSDLVWLLAITMLAWALLIRGLRRGGAVVLLAAYLGFVAYCVLTR